MCYKTDILLITDRSMLGFWERRVAGVEEAPAEAARWFVEHYPGLTQLNDKLPLCPMGLGICGAIPFLGAVVFGSSSRPC